MKTSSALFTFKTVLLSSLLFAGLFINQAQAQNVETLIVKVTNLATGLGDETTFGFNPNATVQFDPKYDFYKMPNALNRQTLYTVNDEDYWMMRYFQPSIGGQTDTVQLGLEPGVSGKYLFSFSGTNSFDPTSYILMEDTKLQTLHDIRSGNYNFTVNAFTDSWTRFVLFFTPPVSISTTNATCSSPGIVNIEQPGPAQWNYTLNDANDNLISGGLLNSSSPLTASVPAGIYSVTLTDTSGYTVVKHVEVNGAQPVVASYNTSASAVEVAQEVTFTSTGADGLDYNWNFGDGTTASGATVTHNYSTEGVYNITLTSNSATGCSSTATESLSVTPASTTGINNVADNNKPGIWSNERRIYIDFTELNSVRANIDIFNVLGQSVANDKFTSSAVYNKEMSNMEAGYLIVRVSNGGTITTKKVFISPQ